MQKPSHDEIALQMSLVCDTEGIADIPMEAFRNLSRFYNGDIRRSLLALQMYKDLFRVPGDDLSYQNYFEQKANYEKGEVLQEIDNNDEVCTDLIDQKYF